MRKKQQHTTHRGARIPLPDPSPNPPNPLVFFALLALLLGACYILANWSAITNALSP